MQATARINKTVSFTQEQWDELEVYLKSVGRDFSSFAKDAIDEKIERDA